MQKIDIYFDANGLKRSLPFVVPLPFTNPFESYTIKNNMSNKNVNAQALCVQNVDIL